MKTLTLFAAAAALLLTACSETSVEPQPERPPVTFTTASPTRVDGAAWTAGDQIGVTMLAAGTTTPLTTNAPYATTAGDGNFAHVSTALYFPADKSAVDFTAYYPYKAAATETFPIDLASEQTDLLYAANAKNVTEGTPSLQFERQMARLVFDIASTASLDGTVVTLTDVPVKGSFDLRTGVLTPAADKATLTAAYASGKATAVVMPGELTTTVKFATPNGQSVEQTLTLTVEKGRSYSYAVTLTPTRK